MASSSSSASTSAAAGGSSGNAGPSSRGDHDQHLIVVSNRLPVTIKADSSVPGGYTFSLSSGGLVSALSGAKKSMSFTWIGWPGISVPQQDEAYIADKLKKDYSCEPVWLDDDVADAHYNGFSNSILWPLFHYHPGEMNFDEHHWLAYREANLSFAEKVREVVRQGDMVWVQDYHLMLLPLMLRTLIEGSSLQGAQSQRELDHVRHGLDGTSFLQGSEALAPAPNSAASTSSTTHGGKGRGTADGTSSRGAIKIGFFLHTPFPSSEIYRILPVRREILLGILHCDLIGFHTYDYARHFLSACTRILGIPTMPNGAEFEGRYVHVGTFPIGIEPATFQDGLRRETVMQRIKGLERRFEGVKIIVGVDRLDYIKGVPQKLYGLEQFLSDHPEWVGKVVLVQVAVPSRQDVEEYQNLRAIVNEAVGRINGRFGTVESMPIHFLHRSVSFDELCALYAISDACLVTSTRDGMNLVSYEYIACQEGRNGVMILSEFAGAAQSLNGSLIVNPWDKFAVADAIHEALTMPAETRKVNFEKLSSECGVRDDEDGQKDQRKIADHCPLLRFRSPGYVGKHTASWWGSSFVKELRDLEVTKGDGTEVDGGDDCDVDGMPHQA